MISSWFLSGSCPWSNRATYQEWSPWQKKRTTSVTCMDGLPLTQGTTTPIPALCTIPPKIFHGIRKVYLRGSYTVPGNWGGRADGQNWMRLNFPSIQVGWWLETENKLTYSQSKHTHTQKWITFILLKSMAGLNSNSLGHQKQYTLSSHFSLFYLTFVI